MKVVGLNDVDRTVIVAMTRDEWDDLQIAAGVTCDKRERVPGTVTSVRDIKKVVEGFNHLGQARKDMIALQKKWNQTMESMDAVLSPKE